MLSWMDNYISKTVFKDEKAAIAVFYVLQLSCKCIRGMLLHVPNQMQAELVLPHWPLLCCMSLSSPMHSAYARLTRHIRQMPSWAF